jgi:hypothetical protein
VSTYRVYLSATASASVKVEIDDDGMDVEEAREAAIEEAYQSFSGSICAQCSGWREPWSQEIGEYEVEDGPDAVEKVEG